jgi:hypothetical protein
LKQSIVEEIEETKSRLSFAFCQTNFTEANILNADIFKNKHKKRNLFHRGNKNYYFPIKYILLSKFAD